MKCLYHQGAKAATHNGQRVRIKIMCISSVVDSLPLVS